MQPEADLHEREGERAMLSSCYRFNYTPLSLSHKTVLPGGVTPLSHTRLSIQQSPWGVNHARYFTI